MNDLDAVIFGIVEGLTEFLPVSSTGHLMMTGELLGFDPHDQARKEFLKSFQIAIQPGAILAILLLYWRTLLVNRQVLQRILVAFLPTGVLGFLFYKVVRKVLLDSLEVVLVSLAVGGVVLILFELFHRERKGAAEGMENISYRQALLLGVFQSLAMIPGVSRSGATIVGGLALGIRRQTIVEFSFLLAVPTMAAATAYDLYKQGANFSPEEIHFLLVGFACSFVVALLAVKGFLRFVKTHTFIPFGIYRILAPLAFWLLVLRRG